MDMFLDLLNQWRSSIPHIEQSWKGKTIVITGSNTGLGFEAALQVARADAEKIVITSRRQEAADRAKADIVRSSQLGSENIEAWTLDLCSYESVRRFGQKARQLRGIDCLICNAGMATTEWRTAEDNEQTITANLISTFWLAFMLLPQLKMTAEQKGVPTHLTIVTSASHKMTTMAAVRHMQKQQPEKPLFDCLREPECLPGIEKYTASKLLGIFMIRQLVYAKASKGYPVVINLVEPGLCATNLNRERPLVGKIMHNVLFARKAEVGGKLLVLAASAGEDTHGQYMFNNRIYPVGKFVDTPEGQEIQTAVWKELVQKLENLEPGVMTGI